jgi:hypothetical protein
LSGGALAGRRTMPPTDRCSAETDRVEQSTSLVFGACRLSWPDLLLLSAVRHVVTVPTMLHERVAILPVVAIVTAIGIRIARSQVLAICIRTATDFKT